MTCSAETSPPRVSFSNDQPHELHVLVPEGSGCDQESRSPEFEFSVSGSFNLESSADELFSNGMILPLRTEPKPSPVTTKAPNRLPPAVPTAKKEERSFRGGLWIGRASSSPVSEEDEVFPRKSVFCSFPLLPRSNSTGSAPSAKRMQSRQPSIAMRKSWSVPSSSNGHSWYQKNGSGRREGHHTVRVSPVLNVPTGCICEGTASFFGLGSWLRGGSRKDKKSGRR